MGNKKREVGFKPLGKNILVLAPVVSETTEAGIIKSEEQIAKEMKDFDKHLEVIAVSDEVMTISVGDKVLFRGNVTTLELDGVGYFILHEASVLGKKIEK
jgi:co-chaperonin GroES (HSP10)